MDFQTDSVLAEKAWARSVGSPSRKAFLFQTLERGPGQGSQREREREKTHSTGDGRRAAHCVPSTLDWVGNRTLGQGCGKGPAPAGP